LKRRRWIWIVVLAAVALAPLRAPAAAPQPNARLLEAVKACDKDARTLMEKAVAIDSGTGDAEGLAAMGALFSEAFKALGAEVAPMAPTPPAVGDNILATFTGTGKGRILLIPHMDTVFSRGDVAKRQPHWQGDRYIGPGAGDDKSGEITAVCALRALKAIGFTDFGRIQVLMNASEETGSQGSKALIQALAKTSDLVLALERGYPGDKVVAARKGSAELIMDFTGRAAHSGLEPQKGRNAALEAARVALALGALSDPAKETTVTVDILTGGDKTNVVPAHAQIIADVRAFSAAELDRVEQQAAALAAHPGIDGVTITSTLQRGFPPWPRSAAADVLVARANRLYAELGRTLVPVSVGSSGDASLAAQAGTPTLDGFAMEGDGAHSVDDSADFSTLTPRAYLLARLLMDVGRDPQGR
jgi:glutamate carboxypeptidase